ncbi:MAG: efflux RND transporter permease subunit [Hyphomicrobiales bacterium]
MKRIIEAFVRFPFYANIFIAVVLIAGIFSLLNLKKSFFPEKSTRLVFVTVTYPGASPKEMEEGITSRIEQSIRGLAGIKEITSTSLENFARVKVETTNDYDIDVMLTEIKNAVDGISSFPLGAERPIVFKQREISQVGFVGLKGDVDLLALKKYALIIEDDLRNSGIVSQLNVNGMPALEISVNVRENDLLRHNLTFSEVINAIKMNNQDVSAGIIRNDEEEMIIRSRARSNDPDVIGNIIIRGDNNGNYLRVHDVADLSLRFEETTNKTYANGTRLVSFAINKLANEDLEKISTYINKYADDFNALHDEVELSVNYNFMEILKQRLNLLYENGLLGLLLVVIVLSLFLSFRLSFWVAFGIPISFLGMLTIGLMAGITINMISLFGMILVIGILVDDGIVIGENIFVHLEKGKSPTRAAIDGTMEVVPAVFTSVITTCVAFAPLLFATGQFEFMYEVAFVVIVSLLLSLIEAFFVLPAHLSSVKLKKEKAQKTEKKGIFKSIRVFMDKLIYWLRDNLYRWVLNKIIRFRVVMTIVPITLIMITVGLFKMDAIKATFFPAIPFDLFTLNMAFTPGSGEKQTEDYLWRFYDTIQAVNEELNAEYNGKNGYEDTADFFRKVYVGMGSAFNGEENGAHAGNIFVVLKDLEGTGTNSWEIVERIRKKIGPTPELEKFNIGAIQTFGNPVAISVLGSDMNELRAAKNLLETKLKQFDELKEVKDNSPLGKREILIEPKEKAYFLGINRAEIARQVRNGFFGGQAQRLQIGRDEVRIYVRYPKEDRLNMGDLENLRIKTPRGEYPLKEVADFKIERGPVTINRYNGKREITIEAGLIDPFEPVPPILARIKEDIIPELKASFPGVDVKFMGQAKESEQSGQDVMGYFLISFVLIVIILMVHFKSAIQGILILMMIPLGWLGAIWGHAINGFPISMLSAWGMVALSGVIINDAVVFLAKYNDNLRKGLSIEEAVKEAGLSRYRPIVLTTLTTFFGLLPLVYESSFQAQFLIPMAISLSFGVLVGTGFILTLFPPLILTTNYIKRAFIALGRYILSLYDHDTFMQKYEGKYMPDPRDVEPAVKYQKRVLND